MATPLDRYLALERTMLELDKAGDPRADRVRDLLDSIWHELRQEDRTFLNKRLPCQLLSAPVR